MSQIATTIEQSKRLLGAGLDPGSADMSWVIVDTPWRKNTKTANVLSIGNPVSHRCTPAWSLSRLWELNSKSYYRLSCPSIKSPEEIIEALVSFICSPDYSPRL